MPKTFARSPFPVRVSGIHVEGGKPSRIGFAAENSNVVRCERPVSGRCLGLRPVEAPFSSRCTCLIRECDAARRNAPASSAAGQAGGAGYQARIESFKSFFSEKALTQNQKAP